MRLDHANRAGEVAASITSDLMSIRDRLGRIHKGQVRFVDVDSRAALAVAQQLEEIGETLKAAIIPSKD